MKKKMLNLCITAIVATGLIGAIVNLNTRLENQIAQTNQLTVELNSINQENQELNRKINDVEVENNKLNTQLKEKDVIIANKNKEIQDLNNATKPSNSNKDKFSSQNSNKTLESNKATQNVDRATYAPANFNPNNLLSKSNVNEQAMQKALKNTGLSDVAGAIVQAEREYGVNSLFLAALIAEESSWGNSNRARNQNNLTGYAVYSDTSKGKSFSSRAESVFATAKLLKNEYLTPGGAYYNGYSIWNVNKKYSSNSKWGSNIIQIANEIKSRC